MGSKRFPFFPLAVIGVVSLFIGILSLFVSPNGTADKFPTKPVQVVIPFPPGNTDNLLRPFVEKMGEFLGQPVSLVYKPGASGAVGARFVADGKPDGHTILGSPNIVVVDVPSNNKEVGYTWESFAPVTALVEGGALLAVQSSSPWKTLQELVEDSKKNPGTITYTIVAFGLERLVLEALNKEAGVKWTYIPSQGSGPAVTALLGGHVKLAATGTGPALAHIKSGTLRPLAVFGAERLKALPEVPTLKESGFNFSRSYSYGLLAPKGTPKEVVNALHAAAKKAAEKYDEQISTRLTTFGAEIKLLGPEEYAAYLKTDHDSFSEILKTIKKTP
jgi:tripartite-type tricarboxylate transporter receptor subunit TctC